MGRAALHIHIPQLRLLPKKKMALCMTSGDTALNSLCRKEALINTCLGEPCLVAPSSWSGVLSMLALSTTELKKYHQLTELKKYKK